MLFKILTIAILLTALPSWAQMMSPMMMGTGYWGANQSCSYSQPPTQAMNTESDEVRELQTEIAELKQEISEKKSEKKKLDREVSRAKSDIKNNLSEEYADFLMAHMDSSRRCSEYTSFNQSDDGSTVTADIEEPGDGMGEPPEDFQPPSDMQPPEGFKPPKGRPLPSAGRKKSRSFGANANMLDIEGFSLQEWQKYCDASKSGAVFTAVCDNSNFRSNGSRTNSSTCKSALGNYRVNSQKSAQIQTDIEGLNRQIENLQEDIKDARKNSQTEGSLCVECMAKNSNYNYQQPQTDTMGLITNVALGAASMYGNYKATQAVVDSNANLGYPTQASYGYPFMSQGMYGALSGGTAQSGFGCGNTMSGLNTMGGMNSMYGMMGSPMMGMSGGIYTGMGSPYGMYGSASMTGLNPSLMYGMSGITGMTGMTGMSGMNGMYGMNGISGMYGSGNMYGMNGMGNMYGTGNMYGMNGMSAMYGTNSMYGSGNLYGMNGMNSQYSMMALQQQMALMNYQMSVMQNYNGVYTGTGTGLYNTGTTSYISPTGLTSSSTTMPGGVILGTSTTYTSPYVNTYNTTATIPGMVPAPTGTTLINGSTLSVGTGR
ncbi:hypothetical protein [Bdellovibrio sp. HCB274]|uniref:hypothetical protein n=1 Tax=Bdellovibrio sp. HCB274 TaxID=3394361 RepID=UPI0039B4FADF